MTSEVTGGGKGRRLSALETRIGLLSGDQHNLAVDYRKIEARLTALEADDPEDAIDADEVGNISREVVEIHNKVRGLETFRDLMLTPVEDSDMDWLMSNVTRINADDSDRKSVV